MIIYPAIDIKSGRCVRLLQGDASKKTDYGDPLKMAARWQEEGAEWLHIVDLDGALDEGGNLPIIEQITKLGLNIQLGGGIRDFKQAKRRFEAGATRVILGTAAIENREAVQKIAAEYPERVVVALDARDGYVKTRGWNGEGGITPSDLASDMLKLSISLFLYTDISKDGMLSGPDIEGTAKLCGRGLNIIGSGGVGSLEDIMALKKVGCAGAIVGKALYEGTVTLAEALRV